MLKLSYFVRGILFKSIYMYFRKFILKQFIKDSFQIKMDKITLWFEELFTEDTMKI